MQQSSQVMRQTTGVSWRQGTIEASTVPLVAVKTRSPGFHDYRSTYLGRIERETQLTRYDRSSDKRLTQLGGEAR